MGTIPSTIKVGFIGAGAMAREHGRAFRDIPNVELVGITSRTSARAQALAAELAIPSVFPDIASLFTQGCPDLVVMAVPEMSIGEVARQAFSHPWAVLMEKPPGHCMEEAEELFQLAQDNARQVWVALNRRHMSSTRAVLDDLQSRPAEARFIRVEDRQSIVEARDIGHPSSVVKHWMYANSIHLMDYLTLLGRGPVEKVTSLKPWNPDHPGTVLALVEFVSGDTGLYEGIWDEGPGPWAVTVNTPSRRWELRPLERAQFMNAGERRLQDVSVSAWDQDYKPGFRVQAEETIKALGGESHRATSFSEAMESMRLVHQVFGV